MLLPLWPWQLRQQGRCSSHIWSKWIVENPTRKNYLFVRWEILWPSQQDGATPAAWPSPVVLEPWLLTHEPLIFLLGRSVTSLNRWSALCLPHMWLSLNNFQRYCVVYPSFNGLFTLLSLTELQASASSSQLVSLTVLTVMFPVNCSQQQTKMHLFRNIDNGHRFQWRITPDVRRLTNLSWNNFSSEINNDVVVGDLDSKQSCCPDNHDIYT